MSLNNKRKSTATHVPENAQPKRRRGERQQDQGSNATPIPNGDRASPIAQPTFRPIARPARWRGKKQEASNSLSKPHNTESPQQPNQHAQQIPTKQASDRDQIPDSRSIQLRFSFTAGTDQNPSGHNRNIRLNKSFSELQVTGHAPQTEAITRQITTATPFIPELSRPEKKKREGYGFSYSETFWCDSDEYPDTECDWDGEDQTTQPSTNRSSNIKQQQQQWKSDDQTTQASFGGSTVVDGDCSFNDAVVLRDVGSFHIARPQRILTCTKATREDTIRLKTQAKALLSQYQESSNIQAQLLTRLERMVFAEQQKSSPNGRTHTHSVTQCALRLQEFLFKIKKGRIETGEHARFVEHEFEWVKWLVEASRTEVMHLRTAGCTCRSDWEEDGRP